jgi:aquaporin NIP
VHIPSSWFGLMKGTTGSIPLENSITSVDLRKRLLAEFSGSYLLFLGVFVVIGARSRSLFDTVALDLGRYATLGLMLFVAVSFFDASSAHFNPAVSLGHAIAKKLSWRDFAAYCAAQTIASLLAAMTATMLVGGPTRRVLPNAARVSSLRAFLFEFGATLLVIAAYFASENQLRPLRALLVGSAAICAALTVGRFTTLGINPARSLGPALWNRFGSSTWIFLVAPLLAGLVAGTAARLTPMVLAVVSSSPSFSLALAGVGELAGTFLTMFLGLAGIRAVGGIIGVGIFYLGPPALLFVGALLLRSQTFFNPAITIALVLARRLNPLRALVLLAAQTTGAILAVEALRSWLQGETRQAAQIIPVERVTPARLFVLEVIVGAVVIGMALRQSNQITKPAAVALTTFAMTATLGGFGRGNANPAWAIGTATGWIYTTPPRQLIFLVGGPLLSALLLGVLNRSHADTRASNDAKS